MELLINKLTTLTKKSKEMYNLISEVKTFGVNISVTFHFWTDRVSQTSKFINNRQNQYKSNKTKDNSVAARYEMCPHGGQTTFHTREKWTQNARVEEIWSGMHHVSITNTYL